MSYTKEIVCLANSRKFLAHCVAGKELDHGKILEWVRPVSSNGNGELSSEDICIMDGQIPRLLDVVRIPIRRRASRGHQTENYLIDTSECWEYVTRIDSSRLDDLCDKVDKLWINGFSSANGINDRIPFERIKSVESSLLLIKPSTFTMHKKYEFGSKNWKIRADFRFRRIRYCIVVTDPIIEESYQKKKAGDYPIEGREVYLTVSLGEEYKGFCYKLVAAVIFGSKK